MSTTDTKPIATPRVVVDFAKRYAALFDLEITNQLLHKIVGDMAVSRKYDFLLTGDCLANQAWFTFCADRDPSLVMFENKRFRVLSTFFKGKPEPYWLVLRIVMTSQFTINDKTTLGDYRDLIAALIDRYGEDTKFVAGDSSLSLYAGEEALRKRASHKRPGKGRSEADRKVRKGASVSRPVRSTKPRRSKGTHS